MSVSRAIKMTRLGTREKLEARLAALGVSLPIDDAVDSDGALSEPFEIAGRRVANRFSVLPMEGWDGTGDGRPTELVERRWRRFGESGAGLVWGGEAYAVRPDGRANPRQLCANPESEADLVRLRETLLAGAADHGHGAPLLGLQLTHSGRFARPEGSPAPQIAFRHPVLDRRVGVEDDAALLSDGALDDLIGNYVEVARAAERAGFDFVDVKACHGYLGHELLSGRSRPGVYGGDLEGRARFLLRSIAAVRSAAPSVAIGVRLSVFDFHPFGPGEGGVGTAETGPHTPFGGSPDGLGLDLEETHTLLEWLARAGVALVCTTAGSPYYNPHIQRPAFYPPSDGYRPPEDPLVGVVRQIEATADLRAQHAGLRFVGSAYTYLQEWLPNVAQALVREGRVDSVGLGRMILSYPTLPEDVLAGRPLARPLVCRTFSDCTTAPRNGLVSGCYPIDPFYKRRPEADRLAALKKGNPG